MSLAHDLPAAPQTEPAHDRGHDHVQPAVSGAEHASRRQQNGKLCCDGWFHYTMVSLATGRAQAIVTGDSALLALENFRGVRLLSLREYLGMGRK